MKMKIKASLEMEIREGEVIVLSCFVKEGEEKNQIAILN